MPMYLGNDRVKGMYLGTDIYNGLYLGSDSSPYDYGIDRYAMPLGTTDEANWTINSGFSSKSSNNKGMYFVEGTAAGNCESPSFIPAVGKKYQYVVSRPTGGTDPSLSSYAAVFAINGTVDGDTLVNILPGEIVTYTYTATSTDPLSLVLFSFTFTAPLRLYLDEVYIKEVS